MSFHTVQEMKWVGVKFCQTKPKMFKSSCERRDSMSSSTPIPLEKALELCREYRNQHKVRLFSQCWGCIRFSKEDPSKMCFHNPPENRGAKLSNKCLKESKWSKRALLFVSLRDRKD